MRCIKDRFSIYRIFSNDFCSAYFACSNTKAYVPLHKEKIITCLSLTIHVQESPDEY